MTLIISHRGLVSAPYMHENTLEAFQAAGYAHVDGFETDVRLTFDRKMVLFHDRRVLGGRLVREMTHREMEASLGFKVPTLEEALAAWPLSYWNLEIKAPEALSEVVRLVKSMPRFNGMLSSFFHGLVIEAASFSSGLEWGLIIGHRPSTVHSLVGGVENGWLRHIVWSFEFMDAECVRRLKKIGFNSSSYGQAGLDEHADCWRAGLHAVITDEPKVAMNAARHIIEVATQ